MGLANITAGVTISDADLAKITAAALTIQQANTQTMPTLTTAPIALLDEYMRVNSLGLTGRPDTLQKAIDMAASAGGGTVIVEPGIHTAPAGGWILPDVPIEIRGLSQEGVILKNTAGEHLFVLHNLTKKYSFNNFSIQSQNTDSYSNMFYMYGDSDTDFTATVALKDISMDLADAGTSAGAGDKGVYALTNKGSFSFDRLYIVDGYSSIHIADGEYFFAASCRLIDQKYYGIVAVTAVNNVTSCNVTDFHKNGITCGGAVDATVNTIAGNNLSVATGSTEATAIIGIYSGTFRSYICSNTISIVTSATPTYITGIVFSNVAKALADKNNININVSSSSSTTKGIEVLGYNSTVSGNVITVDNDDNTANHYGIHIYLNSDGNTVSGNNIDMVNNDAKDIGILIDSGCDNNQGGDNITYNCGTGISDNGASNAVTGKDV